MTFTFFVSCCDGRYGFRIKTMFGSSLPSVVCRRARVWFKFLSSFNMDNIIFVSILSWVIARDKMERKWCCPCQNFMQSRKTTQAARAKLRTRHKTKTNRTKKTIQKSKKMTNTDPTKQSGVEWGLHQVRRAQDQKIGNANLLESRKAKGLNRTARIY
jgi:hypothetical protein